jgi:spermidine/putrescine transport system ATP-binding protein
VINPTVLLLDEPLSNLDLKLREEMRVEIVGIQRRLGITTVFVTHDQSEALVMSDRIAVMNAGRIEQIGDPADIYERPATRFVAEFIGRMNLIAGVVTADRRVRTSGGVELPADVPQDLPAGAPVHIAVRPERARLVRERPAQALALQATVRQVFYLGATREVRLDLAGGERGVVETPNDGTAPNYAAGDVVWLTASIGDCRILAAR